MNGYVLYKMVRGTWAKVGSYKDLNSLGRAILHLGRLKGNMPCEIRIEVENADE